MRRSVHRVQPPDSSAVADWYAGATLLDSYSVPLAGHFKDCSMQALAERALGKPHVWFVGRIKVRDAITAPPGVKTSAELREASATGARVDFFPVLAEQPDELVLGENDWHLDFCLSLLRRKSPQRPQLVATTVVHAHNLLGRVYLTSQGAATTTGAGLSVLATLPNGFDDECLALDARSVTTVSLVRQRLCARAGLILGIANVTENSVERHCTTLQNMIRNS